MSGIKTKGLSPFIDMSATTEERQHAKDVAEILKKMKAEPTDFDLVGIEPKETTIGRIRETGKAIHTAPLDEESYKSSRAFVPPPMSGKPFAVGIGGGRLKSGGVTYEHLARLIAAYREAIEAECFDADIGAIENSVKSIMDGKSGVTPVVAKASDEICDDPTVEKTDTPTTSGEEVGSW